MQSFLSHHSYEVLPVVQMYPSLPLVLIAHAATFFGFCLRTHYSLTSHMASIHLQSFVNIFIFPEFVQQITTSHLEFEFDSIPPPSDPSQTLVLATDLWDILELVTQNALQSSET